MRLLDIHIDRDRMMTSMSITKDNADIHVNFFRTIRKDAKLTALVHDDNDEADQIPFGVQ